LTKPFYGGKKHQISGSICGPDKKVGIYFWVYVYNTTLLRFDTH